MQAETQRRETCDLLDGAPNCTGILGQPIPREQTRTTTTIRIDRFVKIAKRVKRRSGRTIYLYDEGKKKSGEDDGIHGITKRVEGRTVRNHGETKQKATKRGETIRVGFDGDNEELVQGTRGQKHIPGRRTHEESNGRRRHAPN